MPIFASERADLLFPSNKPVFGCLTPTSIFRSAGEGRVDRPDDVVALKAGKWVVLGQGALNVCLTGAAGPEHYRKWQECSKPLTNDECGVLVLSSSKYGHGNKVHHRAYTQVSTPYLPYFNTSY